MGVLRVEFLDEGVYFVDRLDQVLLLVPGQLPTIAVVVPALFAVQEAGNEFSDLEEIFFAVGAEEGLIFVNGVVVGSEPRRPQCPEAVTRP